MVATEAKPGRLMDGTFAKGNKYTPPKHPTVQNLHKFFKLVQDDHIEAVYNRVLQLCLHSDDKISLAACEMFLNRICGKIKEEMELTQVTSTLSRDEAMSKLRTMMNEMEKPVKMDIEVLSGK
jgi:hypothetical protein